MTAAVAPLLAFVVLALLAACSSSQLEDLGQGNTSSATGQTQKPPVDMAGRWTLAASGRGQCAMIFAGAPGARQGTIAPEGGCPGNFFTSRKWDFEQASLVIRDHNSEPLAQLTMADATRFDGKTNAGEPVTLTR